MQIDELKNEGLEREFKVTVEKDELDQRIETILMDLKGKVRMKGFRPGKAPLSLLKQLHGEAAFGQAVQDSVQENTDKIFADRNIRPAVQPKVEVGDVDKDKGFDFTVKAEILPEIKTDDFKAPALQRLTAKPSDADVDKAIEELAGRSKSFDTAAKTYKAKSGDAVIIDFEGRIDGEAFEGGKAEDFQLELGSGQFIEGFEDQLIGVKTGEEKTVNVPFPENYGRKDLAGKDAEFSVTVKEVKKPVEAKIDDDLAKNFGLESLDKLKEAIKDQLESEAQQLSRAKVKRALLDELADQYDFEVPPSMVDMEFRDIWAQIKRDAVASGAMSQEEADKLEEPEDEEERAEYKSIAERRVRLGLLLSELGLKNNVTVGREELMRRVAEEARRFPGQEQQVFEFYTKNEQALAQIRAPLYEDKVVDFILELAELKEKEVSLEDLREAVRADDEAEEEKKPAKKASSTKKKSSGTAKKSASKKTTSSTTKKKAPAKKASGTSKTAAKKPAAKKTTKAADKSATKK